MFITNARLAFPSVEMFFTIVKYFFSNLSLTFYTDEIHAACSFRLSLIVLWVFQVLT